MNIYVLNKSSVLQDAEIQSWIPAFNQFADDVARFWPRSAKLIWCALDHEPAEAWKVVFSDFSDVAGALGYHDFTPGGRPISYVFAGDDKKYGYSVTIDATHEIGEMLADPWCSETFQVSNTQFYAKEICDPVEDDSLGYTISIPGFPPVLCSDFVTPNWFIPGSPKTYDKTKKVSQPLELLQGGYMSVFTSGKGWNQIYAKTASSTASLAKNDPKRKAGYGRLGKYGRDRG